MMKEEKHVSQGTAAEIAISKFFFVLITLLFPLIVGKLFGIIAERFAYGIVICFLALRAIDALLMLDGISVAIEKGVILKEEREKEHDPAERR